VGRDIATIVPEPIASHHSLFLESYLATGKQRVLGRSRALLFLHKGGYLVPVRMNLAASVTGEEWFAAAEEVRTHWNFVFVAGADAGFRVTAACRSAASVLGLDLLVVRAGAVTLEHLLHREVEDVLADLAVNADKLLFVALRAGVEGATVNVLARLQSLRLQGMEEAFHILRFRRATPLEEQAALQGGLQEGPTAIASPGGLHGSRLALPATAAQSKAVRTAGDDDGDGQPQRHTSGMQAKGTWAIKSPHPAPAGADEGACPFLAADAAAPRLTTTATTPTGGSVGAKPRHVSFVGTVTSSSSTVSPRPAPTQSWDTIPRHSVVALTEVVATAESMPPGLQAFFLQPYQIQQRGPMPAEASTLQAAGPHSAASELGLNGGIPVPWQGQAADAGSQAMAAPADARALSGEHGGSVSDAPSADASGSMLELPNFIPDAELRTAAADPYRGTSRAARSSALTTADSNEAIKPPRRSYSPEDAGATPLADPVGGPAGIGRAAGSFSSLPARSNPGVRSQSSGRVSAQTTTESAKTSTWSWGLEAGGELAAVGNSSTKPDAHAAQETGGLNGVAGALTIRAPRAAASKAHVVLTDGHGARKRDSGVRLDLAGTDDGTDGSIEDAQPATAWVHARTGHGRRVGAPPESRYHSGRNLAGLIRGGDQGVDSMMAAHTPVPMSPTPLLAEASATAGATSPVAGAPQGKAPSVHSRGSGASSSSAADLLRKGITAKGARLERSLVILDRAIIIAFLVVAAMNIASLAVISNQVAQLSDSLDLVGATARRALDAQRITFGLMDLNLVNRGQLPQVTDNGTALKHFMLVDAAAFEDEHSALFARVNSAYPQEFDLYTAPSVPTENMIQGQYVDMDHYNRTVESISLMNAASEFLIRVRRVANLPLTSFTRANSDVLYVIRNGLEAFRLALNQTILLADQHSATQADTIDTADQVVLAVALCIFCAIGTCVILPAVGAVLRARRAVFDVFLDVPIGVLRALRSKMQRRITAEQQAEDGDDVGTVAELDDDGGSTPFSPTTPGVYSDDDDRGQGGERRPSIAIADGGVTFGQNGLRAAVAASNSTASAGRPVRIAKRRFQRANSSATRLIVAMLLPLLFYCAAYVGIFFWHRGVVDASRLAKNEVLYAHQLEFSVLQTTMHVRTAAVETAPVFVASQVAKGRDQIANAIRRLDWLAYGNAAEPRISPMLQSGTVLATLLGGNACLRDDDRYYSESSCESFRDGILWSNGLLGGIRDFRAAAMRILDTLDVDLLHIFDLTSGDGGLVHSFGSAYLRPALREFSRQSRMLAEAHLQAFSTLNIVVTVLLVLLLAAVYGLVYKPRVSALVGLTSDNTAQIQHALLLQHGNLS